MSNLDSLFESMGKSEVSTKAKYFTGGVYTLKPISLKFHEGYKGQSFIAEFKIVSADNGTPEGVTRSWVLGLSDIRTRDRNLGNIKQLFWALAGTDPETVGSPESDPGPHQEAVHLFKCAIDPKYAAEHGIDPSDFIGVPVRLEATEVETKPTPLRPEGGKYTRMAWSPFDASEVT